MILSFYGTQSVLEQENEIIRNAMELLVRAIAFFLIQLPEYVKSKTGKINS